MDKSLSPQFFGLWAANFRSAGVKMFKGYLVTWDITSVAAKLFEIKMDEVLFEIKMDDVLFESIKVVFTDKGLVETIRAVVRGAEFTDVPSAQNYKFDPNAISLLQQSMLLT